MNILLTGGTGYIGSHTAVVLAEAGHNVVLYDNLSNSKPEVVDRLETILGTRPLFIEGDIRDRSLLAEVLKLQNIDAVVHFAGLKAVGESVEKPLDYYHNNVYGSLCLMQALQDAGVKRLVFSSSATVYGEPQYLPIDEAHPTAPTNPYGWNKLHIEQMLSDMAAADPEWRIASLRYFNPVGAHESGLIGEDPNGIPNNLMPYIARVAAGKLPHLNVFGNDYPTPDGTGIRDYIHVMDLAEGHLAALAHLNSQSVCHDFFNLGTGNGCSVLEMRSAFETASNKKIPYQVVGRRPGDTALVYSATDKSKQELDWRAARGLDLMCNSAWKFNNK
ncbi:UDP-glucose 4-epimerase [Arenimonas maotaiensis]|uniref:UDP-glucose 4-epimerase n=1 Tax=Arenimonas maotaiensis TaxID=1446479 RepID=A0A917FIT6_9GAMM|nr:UDP-glucose 4-epimerase GalE [Arenimonas maotaiensis]GGF86257.1 UDP-glucose 4-epimerase [Arenimonas maotaiensis]